MGKVSFIIAIPIFRVTTSKLLGENHLYEPIKVPLKWYCVAPGPISRRKGGLIKSFRRPTKSMPFT